MAVLLPVPVQMRLRSRLRVVTRHVVAMLAFMVMHFTFATPMLVAATGRDHRLVLLGVQLG